MRLRISIVVGALLALLMTLPTAGASFTDATSSDGNAFRARQPIRVTTYEITIGEFAGTSYDLGLAQPLVSDYFVIMRGAAGDGSKNGHRSPDQDYARVIADPFGNFASGSTGPTTLRLGRGTAGGSSWQGQITVVESLDSQDTDGFRLRGVAEPSLGAGATTGSASVGSNWSALGRVGLYGGIQGGGVSTTSTDRRDHLTAWGRFYPSGSNTANVERLPGATAIDGSLSGTTTFSAYAVEWGSNWSIQHTTIEGDVGGSHQNDPVSYITTGITNVARANTFVLASGTSNSSKLDRGWEASLFTLGNGSSQNATEATVAIGGQGKRAHRKAEIYVHTHPRLAVDYRLGTIPTGSATGTQSVDAALAPEAYAAGGVRRTAGWRVPIFTNSSRGDGTAYPRPIYWARHTGDTRMTWFRSRTGQAGSYWLQSVDFGEIWR